MVWRLADPRAFEFAAAALERGGVAVLPCDTIYGLVGIAPDTEARLRAIKGRGEDKPFLMLIAESAWLAQYTDLPLPPPLAFYWPGPLTLLFPGRGNSGAVAFRVPRDAFLLTLLRRIGKPLFSTSVNRAGEKHLWKIADIIERYEPETDLIVDGGDLPEGEPSTILDLTTRPWKVVRRGILVIPPEVLTE